MADLRALARALARRHRSAPPDRWLHAPVRRYSLGESETR